MPAGVTARMPRLRPYQAEIARAILGRIADRRGGSISVEVARQGGKNEVSAQVELATLLAHATHGGTIVKCAPTATPQAQLSLDRLHGRAVEAGLEGFVRRTGHGVRCGAARAEFLSAERGANVVGHTASLLLEVDEAQDVNPEKFDRDFRPMAASTNAPVVYYGTPWGAGSLLARARAEHVEAERRDGIRRCFRFDWTAVAEHVPAYASYVAGERDRLGERHPLFRTQYLLEEVDEAGRLFDDATLAQMSGDHPRLRLPVAGERYVAGLDLAGPDLQQAARGARASDRDWTVLTIARVRPGIRSGPNGLADPVHIEVVEHQAWKGTATEDLVLALADRLRRVWRVRRLAVDATGRRRAGRGPADRPPRPGAGGGGDVHLGAEVAAGLRPAGGGALRATSVLRAGWQPRAHRVPTAADVGAGGLPRERRDAVRRRSRSRA